MKKNIFKKICIIFIILLCFLLTQPYTLQDNIQAQTVDKIENQINEKKDELDKINQELKQAQDQLTQKKQNQNQASSEVDKLNTEIEAIDSEIQLINIKFDQIKKEKNLKQLEKQNYEKKQDIQVKDSYLSWKTGDFKNSIFSEKDVVKHIVYQEMITTKSQGGITEIEQELKTIKKKYQNYETEIDNMQKDLLNLEKKKQNAQKKLSEIQNQVNSAKNSVSGLRQQGQSLQAQIDQLTKEQQEMQNKELDIINQNPGSSGSGGSKPLQKNEYYFSGTGRDLYQGHGVGMSQFGALGAALQGWDYKKIVEFYFPGAKVVKSSSLPATINVDGVGHIPIETYTAGLGEVPDFACENLGKNFDPKNIWSCWPKEVIKAQVVVARTYAARRSGFIYRDTRAQVYKGGTNKKWAADATKNEVVLYGGGLANVYYSSDNNQGKGNANNETIWSNYSGNATSIPYLRSVNDNAFAFKTKWTNWGWRTNSYSIKDMQDFLSWASTSGSVSYSARNFSSNIKSTIGTLNSFSFERDPSSRVHKVIFKGNKGNAKMAGWLFKSIWNIWVGTVKPSGEADYIYSLTFYWNAT